MLLTMETKTAAQHKLETMIEKGRATAGSVIEHVMGNQPKDRLVRSRDLTFVASPDAAEITVSFPDGPRAEGAVSQGLHRNALTQMAQATDLHSSLWMLSRTLDLLGGGSCWRTI